MSRVVASQGPETFHSDQDDHGVEDTFDSVENQRLESRSPSIDVISEVFEDSDVGELL